MSFIPAIKDYIVVVNNLFDSLSGDLNPEILIKETSVYLFVSIKCICSYFFTFQWLPNLSYFPNFIPQIQSSILNETYFLENPVSTIFTFLEKPTYGNNKLLLGFLNSFFLSLPLSCGHIITIRRLLMFGILPGVFSGLGTILGQWCFLTTVLFGFRSFIILWFSFPLLQLLIVIPVFILFFLEVFDKRYFDINKNQTKTKFVKFFLLNFILSWTEQACVFQYFGNLTFGPEPTALETFYSNTELFSFIITAYYVLGLLFGSFFFTGFFGFLIIRLNTYISSFFNAGFATLFNRFHILSRRLVVVYIFLSNPLPYYNIDYLLTGPLGFLSSDKALQETVFSLDTFWDKGPKNEDLIGKTFDVDLSTFDHGSYLEDHYGAAHFLTFEQLGADFLTKALTDRVGHESIDDMIRERYGTRRGARAFHKFVKDQSKGYVFRPEKRVLPIQKKDIFDYKKIPKDERLDELCGGNVIGEEDELGERYGRDKRLYKFRDWHAINQIFITKYNLFSKNETKYQKDFNFQGKKLRTRVAKAKTGEGDENEQLFQVENALKLNNSTDFFEPNLIEEKSKQVLKKKVETRTRFNSFYKSLVRFGFDSFNLNQPTFQKLTTAEEKKLFEKRVLLGTYYDGLRYYKELPYIKDFRKIYKGSKSDADKVFNHQYKGTVKHVRKMFAMTETNKRNRYNDPVFKFDQPLYLDNDSTSYKNLKPFHEELAHFSTEKNFKNKKKQKKIFLEISNSTPFYVGWDQGLRKLVITNRLLGRSLAGYVFYSPTKIKEKEYKTLPSFIDSKKKILFTTWPLSKSTLNKQVNGYLQKGFSKTPYVLNFESVHDRKNKEIVELIDKYLGKDKKSTDRSSEFIGKNPTTSLTKFKFEYFPTSLTRYKELHKNEPIDKNRFPFNFYPDAEFILNPMQTPNQGGFFWPGDSTLKFQLLPEYIIEKSSKFQKFLGRKS